VLGGARLVLVLWCMCSDVLCDAVLYVGAAAAAAADQAR